MQQFTQPPFLNAAIAMKFLAEQHLSAAKMARDNGVRHVGPGRHLFIKISNSLVVCALLAARDRGGISLAGFDWTAVSPNWSFIDKQMQRLEPPQIDGPSIIPGYYNSTRTHLSLDKDAPVSRAVERVGNILCRPILGGLHHQYARI